MQFLATALLVVGFIATVNGECVHDVTACDDANGRCCGSHDHEGTCSDPDVLADCYGSDCPSGDKQKQVCEAAGETWTYTNEAKCKAGYEVEWDFESSASGGMCGPNNYKCCAPQCVTTEKSCWKTAHHSHGEECPDQDNCPDVEQTNKTDQEKCENAHTGSDNGFEWRGDLAFQDDKPDDGWTEEACAAAGGTLTDGKESAADDGTGGGGDGETPESTSWEDGVSKCYTYSNGGSGKEVPDVGLDAVGTKKETCAKGAVGCFKEFGTGEALGMSGWSQAGGCDEADRARQHNNNTNAGAGECKTDNVDAGALGKGSTTLCRCSENLCNPAAAATGLAAIFVAVVAALL